MSIGKIDGNILGQYDNAEHLFEILLTQNNERKRERTDLLSIRMDQVLSRESVQMQLHLMKNSLKIYQTILSPDHS